MRVVRALHVAFVLAGIALTLCPSEAIALGPIADGISSMAIAVRSGGSVEKAYWVRRCGRWGCRRWWVYAGPTVNESCLLWRATHWGLRRAWVC